MLIDDSRAPFVFLRAELESKVSIEEQFERLFGKGEPFVLVHNHSADEHHEETSEEKKEKALFFKRIKSRLRGLCRGMIVVETGGSTRSPARLAASAASKALGFAVAFASDEEDAINQGKALLTKGA